MTDIPWSWFVMRSTGLVALSLLTVAVVLGVLGPRLRPTARLAAISTHRAASAVGALLILVHILLAVLDPWIDLSWVAALVPGSSGWETWGMALSALSVDLLLVLLLTTATRRWAPRAWRKVHLVAYPVWALAVGHGLLVGSDGAVMRALALISLALVLAAVSVRLVTRPVAPRPLGRPVDAAVGGPADAVVGGAR